VLAVLLGLGPSQVESLQARPAAPVGYVLAVQGEWRLKGMAAGQRIAAGRALNATDTIVAGTPPWDGRQITIIWRDTAATYVCAEPAASTPHGFDCRQSIPMHAPAVESVWPRIVEAFAIFIRLFALHLC
jgi:hypothetical protein